MNNQLSRMSSSDEPSPPTNWAFQYWPELHEQILQHNKRKAVLKILTANPLGTFSTTALADTVNNPNYTDQNLNKVLPEFERLGLVSRIPKFERDDSYLILPNQRILGWINSSVEWADPRDHIFPADTPAEDNWATAYTGVYITERFPDIDPSEAGLPVGPESVIYSSINEYREQPQAQTQTGAAADSDTDADNDIQIDFQMGSLEVVRDAEFQLDSIVEPLSLGTSIPDPDGPYVGDDGVHDYAIFGRVSGISRIVHASQLEHRLEQQLSVWLASAQSHYSQRFNQNPPTGAGTGDGDDDDDTDTDAGSSSPQLSSQQRKTAVQAVREHDPIPGARERFGVDAVVTLDDPGPDVCFGLYRRTGNDPQSQFTDESHSHTTHHQRHDTTDTTHN